MSREESVRDIFFGIDDFFGGHLLDVLLSVTRLSVLRPSLSWGWASRVASMSFVDFLLQVRPVSVGV